MKHILKFNESISDKLYCKMDYDEFMDFFWKPKKTMPKPINKYLNLKCEHRIVNNPRNIYLILISSDSSIEISIFIYEYIDEYYLVDIHLENGESIKIKCDQLEGLLSLLNNIDNELYKNNFIDIHNL